MRQIGKEKEWQLEYYIQLKIILNIFYKIYHSVTYINNE